MRHAQPRAGLRLMLPPAEIGMAAAQIDHGLEAVAFEERAQDAQISLCRPRRLAGHDPVEIVEKVEKFAHRFRLRLSSVACAHSSSISNAGPTGWGPRGRAWTACHFNRAA